jgi:galactokinase/mevalonate kinase-like predicted kinase
MHTAEVWPSEYSETQSGVGSIIRAKAPVRVSFAGGGTDFPHWYNENGGAALSTTINQYARVTLYPREDQAVRGSCRGMEIAYSHEEMPLGTVGALRQAAVNSPGDLFLAMNGDSYTAADLSAFLCSHSQSDALGSILLAWAPDCARYGTVAFDGAGRVVRCAFY